MENIKFLVKLNRAGEARYVTRVDQLPVQTTPDRKRALLMGKFAAEDVLKALTNPRCKPEMVPVKVSA